MKVIKDLTVEVTYTVQLRSVDIPDEVYGELMENRRFYCSAYTDTPDSLEWLANNIHEIDVIDFEYEILNFE